MGPKKAVKVKEKNVKVKAYCVKDHHRSKPTKKKKKAPKKKVTGYDLEQDPEAKDDYSFYDNTVKPTNPNQGKSKFFSSSLNRMIVRNAARSQFAGQKSFANRILGIRPTVKPVAKVGGLVLAPRIAHNNEVQHTQSTASSEAGFSRPTAGLASTVNMLQPRKKKK